MLSKRSISVLVALGLVLGACSTPKQEIYEVPPEKMAEEMRLPPPTPAVPAYVIRAPEGFDPEELAAIDEVEGTAVVATMHVERFKVKGRTIKVGGVDPMAFRPIAPSASRDADFVWLSLLSRYAVVTHDVSGLLTGKEAGDVRLPGAGKPIPVGALADNSHPNVADVIVAKDQVETIEWGEPDLVIVGAETGTTLQNLGRDLRTVATGGEVERIPLETTRTVRRQDVPQPYVGAPASSTSVAGLHPTLAESVRRVMAASDGRVWIVSGFRTTARQYELWVGALQKYGDPEIADNWVAPPGHSYHERGLAVDLGGDVEYAAQLVAELRLPLWRPMSWEPWHFEVVGSRG
ncbi:MAG TPA: D-alanyl-D-alanine carboxypeptidase family protein [Actinomycetota bacterium]|nr:D-alanyl-D-alanine carboxypeptidase family protein [Actinomycetota bacterium]